MPVACLSAQARRRAQVSCRLAAGRVGSGQHSVSPQSCQRQPVTCRQLAPRSWCVQSQMEKLLASTTVATAALTMLVVLCVYATMCRLRSAAALAVISRLIRILQVAQACLDHPPPRHRRKRSHTRRCRLPSSAVQQTQATVNMLDAATVPQLAH